MAKRTRVIIFLVCSFLFILITPSIVLYSQGYRIDLENKKFTQTGGLFLKILPRQTDVYIDGKLNKRTDFFFGSVLIENLLPKKYKVEVKKEEHHSWEKTLEIKEKEVTEDKNIILFPQNINFSVLASQVEQFWFSPDQRKIILKEKEEPGWVLKLYDLNKNIKSHLIGQEDISPKEAQLINLDFSEDSKKIYLEVSAGEESKLSSSPFVVTWEEELEKEIEKFERKIKKEEFQNFLSGKYDRGPAILSVYAGTGGQDAQDWATMLLRMYERYCALKSFQSKILHQSFGQAGGPEGRIGTKSVDVEIKGPYAYGLLKKETGVHRLVRISPFSAKQLRHTSFASVEVLPEIEKEDEIEIKPDDLKIDFCRASGPGGQYVNKRETSVRITHLPTGLVVVCQSERLQGDNRKKAMQVLLSKIYQLDQETKKKELSEIKGKKISASWGNQIRSYVWHPYKLVKDLRTGIKTSDVEGILGGNLDQFIEAEIKI